MSGFVVVELGMRPILFLHRWVGDVQLLGHYPEVVLPVVANLDVDVTANVANGDVGLDGYVHTIAISNVVDFDVDRFATFDVVDVFLLLLLLILPLYLLLLSLLLWL